MKQTVTVDLKDNEQLVVAEVKSELPLTTYGTMVRCPYCNKAWIEDLDLKAFGAGWVKKIRDVG